MSYIGGFVEEVRNKREHLQRLMGNDPTRRRIEDILCIGFENHWHTPPEARQVYPREFAIDSSSAYRGLANGVDIFIVPNIIVGSDRTKNKAVRFEAIKSGPDSQITSDFERMLRDLTEVEAALGIEDQLRSGDVLLIDGSLYGRLTHFEKELALEGWHDLPLRISSRLQRLLRICGDRGVMLVGISKFSRTNAVCHAILNSSGATVIDPGFLDVEAIWRWRTDLTGYTTPLMMGLFALQRTTQLRNDPEEYIRNHFKWVSDSNREWVLETLRGVFDAPAIAMTHLVPSFGEQPIRIDVPVSCLGRRDHLRDVDNSVFLEPEVMSEVVGHILNDYGGRDVYNALLYVADKEVRLSGEEVDTVYKQILNDELGIHIEYDRSSRRFH